MFFYPASGVKAYKETRAMRASVRGGRRTGSIDAMVFRSIRFALLSSLAGAEEGRNGMVDVLVA